LGHRCANFRGLPDPYRLRVPVFSRFFTMPLLARAIPLRGAFFLSLKLFLCPLYVAGSLRICPLTMSRLICVLDILRIFLLPFSVRPPSLFSSMVRVGGRSSPSGCAFDWISDAERASYSSPFLVVVFPWRVTGWETVIQAWLGLLDRLVPIPFLVLSFFFRYTL